ncbi:MAG: 2-C-methyl-D-erythritol 4-phosphate cytidylyltransferase [Bacteroidales bacterium]|jgi:2-C-methyl-D-erythritol 4-phosphate cytidylyltransferase|nr:2-C-methyl-D-erythritol 4-phosphate cytidylyltransferase [Bacteroidales bacterium]
MQLYAVIVAGGAGKRMQATVPKQFLELAGRPVLMHTIERFKDFDSSVEIITVLPASQLQYWTEVREKHSFSVPHTVVEGGAERFYSVQNGLACVPDCGLVAIHDGVRPLVSHNTIKRCIETAVKCGNAIPAVAIDESLRILAADGGSSPINRQTVRAVQTPQVFSAHLIKRAYRQAYRQEFTDDATVLEAMGIKINLVEGNRENIKITTPEDLLISDALINNINTLEF